jgi:hypothetical protein
LKPGALVVFGELHGTNEIPAFVAEAACAASRRGRVHVGFELPVEDAPALRAFLAGSADEGLRDSAFWRAPYPYGMSSKAILSALGKLRDLRHAGAPVDVFFFDDRRSLGIDGRDEAMANVISTERRRAPRDLFLILVGNYHARKGVGSAWNPRQRWMASFLASTEDGLTTLDVRMLPGTAWVCVKDKEDDPQVCGAKAVGRNPSETPPDGLSVRLNPDPALGYDGTYFVGAVTASPPAYSK